MLLLLLFVLAFAAAFAAAALAAFGPPTVDPHPPLPLLQCLTFQNDNNNFLQPICRYPTECPREDTPPPPPSLPPPFGAHTSGLHCSGYAPSSSPSSHIRASLLLLLCEKHTLAAFDLPKCVYCFCLLFVLFLPLFAAA